MTTDIANPNDFHDDTPIVLATHGLEESDAAVRATAQLAASTRRRVTVIGVLEPPPLVAGAYGFAVPVEPVWEDRRAALRERLHRQMTEVVGHDPGWPIEIHDGEPAATIAREAERAHAALIVMGLGRHNVMDRIGGGETALRTLRAAHTPVFAVPQSYTSLPRRAVVALDFSTASLAAAQQALMLLPSLTTLTGVHVTPHWNLEPVAYAQWRIEYERGVGPAFERLLRDLDVPTGVEVSTAIREGKTTKELLKAAEEGAADVIIVGSRGLGFFDRVLVGSTATGIIRGAHCAVFAMPIVAVGVHAEMHEAEAESGAGAVAAR